MYKVNYDESGIILGFYIEEIHKENIPKPNKNITDELWQFLLKNPNKKIKSDSFNKEELIEDDFEDNLIVALQQEPTETEKLRADVDYIAIMAGVDL